MLDKLKQKFQDIKHLKESPQQIPAHISSPTNGHISANEIYKYRYNYGVNLGSLFVLESWIYDDLFDAEGSTEFEAVTNQITQKSEKDAIDKLSSHYDNYISQIDWKWLKEEANITAIRVPIGYWHVANGKFVANLPFASLQKIYDGAKPWDYLQKLISKAKEYQIGILIDIHGLPNGANNDSHSGATSSQSFFQSSADIDIMCSTVLPYVAKTICRSNENVIGLQVVNEAQFDEKGDKQKKYYKKAIESIIAVNPSLPVIISDGWWPQQWSDWLIKSNLQTVAVVDTHIYRCFADSDKAKNAEQIIADLSKTTSLPKDSADFVVGEFSCVLDQQTWDKTSDNKDQWVQKYGVEQTNCFAKNASWGWFFWTLQFQHGDGGEWGFVPMVNRGAIPKRPRKRPTAINGDKLKNIVAEHVNYWQDKGGENFEHWRYQDGLAQAVSDIEEFAKFDNSRIGRLVSWKAQRRQQYIDSKKDSKYMWEWDQGYQRGFDEFNKY